MNPLNKARELALAIKRSDEYIELKRLEEEISSNNRYRECYELYIEENSIKGFTDEERNKIQEYIKARDNFNNIMKDINTIISFSIGYVREGGNCSKCDKCK